MKTLFFTHFIDDDPESIQPIVDIAAGSGFHLNIVVLGVLPTVTAYGPPGAAGFYYDGLDQEIIEAVKERTSGLSAKIADTDVSATISMECRQHSTIEPAIQGHAMLADLSVFPHGTALAGDAQAQAFNGALLGSGRPVLITGSQGVEMPGFRKILFAWNGQVEAAKAMHHAVTLAARQADVHIAIVDPHESAMGPNPGDDVAAYLARHGLAATVDRLPLGDRSVSQILIERANDVDADAVFMGAYGKSRFREWLLGGTTREMLRACELPIVMSN